MTTANKEFAIFDEQLFADRAYWLAKLSPELRAVTLWPDHDRTDAAAEYAQFRFPFESEICCQLSKLTNNSPFLIYAAFVTGLSICLHKYSGQSEITIGSPVLNNENPYALSNLVTITNEMSGSMSFRDLLLRVKETLLEAYSHQAYPLELVLRDLGLNWNGQKNPLFDIVAGMEKIHAEMPKHQVDIRLKVGQNVDGMWIEVDYDQRSFEEETVRRVLGHLNHVLKVALADTNLQLREIEIVNAVERQRLVEEWNRTEAAYDRRTVVELFEEQAKKRPNALAVVCAGERVSYGELNERANRLGRYLQKKGVKGEELVGVVMERSVEMVVAILGVLKAGGAYVPVDPGYPEERKRYVLEDAEARVILAQPGFEPLLLGTDIVILDACSRQFLDENPSNLGGYKDLRNLAYVIYTSGSTGRPKGVEITHEGLTNLSEWQWHHYGVKPDDKASLLTSPAFDASVHEMWPYLIAGGCLCVPDHQTRSFPPKLVSWLTERQIKFCFVPTALAGPVVHEALQSKLALQALMTGGERLRAQKTDSIPFRFFNHYGPTENTVVTTYAPILCGEEKDPPIGKPIANVQVYVLDEHFHPVPVGIPGELYIGGIGLARGYHARADLTAERFIPNPFGSQPGQRLYKTGDLVRYRKDSQLEFLGRNDYQVKVSGYRIELREVELALEEHFSVSQAIVQVQDGPGGGNRMVAYIVSRADQKIDVHGVRSFLKDKLPHFMIPSAFLQLDAIPMTIHGKIDGNALSEIARRRAVKERAASVSFSPIAELVARIYSEVLNVASVEPHDNFFAVGGNSLHATQTVSRINNVLQIDIPLQSIFESPTVEGLAVRIEARLRSGGSNLTLIRRKPQSRVPLSFAQERLWVAHQLDPSSPAYNVPGAVRVEGLLNPAALESCVTEIIRRHECLRTIFAEQDEGVVGIVLASVPGRVEIIDLTQLSEEEKEGRAMILAREEACRPFDLARGPLLRLFLLRMSDENHILLLTMHHIVCDGWSIGVLLRELMAFYQTFATHIASGLAELRFQYSDYAAWQQEQFESGALNVDLTYWRRQLEGAPELLPLPLDRPRPAVRSFAGALHQVVLAPDLLEALESFAQREYMTFFMLLLAAFESLLHCYSGTEDIVVGTDIANRNRLEIEDLIGFFVNNVALRTDLSGNPTFRELLKRVRKTTLDAFVHQDFPFDRLVKHINPQRQRSYVPLIQVLLVLQNAPSPVLQIPGLKMTPMEFDTGTSKFDIAVMNVKSDAGLLQTWTYNTDVFDASTIVEMASNLKKLLCSMLDQPDIHLHELDSLLKIARKRSSVPQQELSTSKAKSLRAFSRKSVTVSDNNLVKTSYLGDSRRFPLVVTPNASDVDLPGWAKANLGLIESNLLQHGAVLFRNFNISSAEDFESFAQAICPELFGEYGDLPREELGGKVYGSTPYPEEKAILFHNESSHLPRWPLKIWFFCVKAATVGGETPILDCREVYRLLDPKIRNRFEEKGLLYVRNFFDGLDVRWQQFFGTEDPSRVEEQCRALGMTIEWKQNGSLKTRQRCPAVRRHPKTGETIFFNQIQLHHLDCLDDDVRGAVLSIFGEEEAPRNVFYGDGSSIETSVIQEITDLYKQTAVAFPWQEGDVLMVDNMLTAHARNPFRGQRKILVAMAEMTS